MKHGPGKKRLDFDDYPDPITLRLGVTVRITAGLGLRLRLSFVVTHIGTVLRSDCARVVPRSTVCLTVTFFSGSHFAWFR